MNKILITGGLGFIGSEVALKLAESNIVKIIDNQQFFFDKGIDNYNYYLKIRKQKIAKKNIEVELVNLLDLNKLKTVINTFCPNIIIHFAGISVAGIADYHPNKAKEHIFDASFNLINIPEVQNINQFIYISSSMVYGSFPKNKTGDIIPPAENFTCNPIDIYGSLKLCCENLVKAFHARKKLQYTIIRPSAVYGFGDCNFRVSELFASNAILKRPLVLDNGGLHLLDFTYIDDLVNGICLATNNDKAINQTFNLSYGEGRSIKELAHVISSIIPGTNIISGNSTPFRPNRGAMNISKAKELLAYNPVFSLEQGMSLYIEQIKEHIKNLNYPEIYY